MQELINLDDFERAARERLDAGALGYFASGADDEVSLSEATEAWRRLRLLPRVMRGLTGVDLRTTVLGQPLDWPVLVAPMAMQGLAHPEGEAATARAAGRAGTAMILSTISNTPVEEVVAASSGPTWFQLYVYRDRAMSRDLVQRVEAAGCAALVLTVDLPHLGRREADIRIRFNMPAHLDLPNVGDRGAVLKQRLDEAGSSLAAHASALLDPSLSWRELEWLCGLTRLPVLVKGVLHPRDAVLATEHGASAIIVSNHGGRQLDTALASADALPAVVEAVAGRAEILVDGGIRRGTDVVKALALGARAVLLGRPVLWGLAVGGADGAERVLALLRDELRIAMALCGCARVQDVVRDLVVPS